MGIIQKTKPLIGQINLEDELRILEEKANASYGAYKEQLDTKKRLEEENVAAKEEIQALIKQIESEQGNLSQYTDRQASASAEKTRLEGVLADAGKQLIQMQDAREGAIPRGERSQKEEEE